MEVWRNRNALAPISRCARVLPHHARMLRLFPTRTLGGDNRTQIRRKKCSAAAGRRCGETLPSLGRFIRRTDSDREREIGLGDCSNAPVLCDHDRERTHRHTKGGARYRPSSLTFVFSSCFNLRSGEIYREGNSEKIRRNSVVVSGALFVFTLSLSLSRHFFLVFSLPFRLSPVQSSQSGSCLLA